MPRPAGRRPSRRAEGDASLGSALKNFLRSSGMAVLLEHPAVASAWESIVGPETLKRARIQAFRRGVLEIAVNSSALMNDMEFGRAALLQQMRQKVKKPFISRISFVLRETSQEEDGED